MKKVLAIVVSVFLLVMMLPLGAVSVSAANDAEYALFPGSVLKVTQGAFGEYNSYSHNGQGGYYQNAFDLGGNSNYCAPFSGTITKIKTSYNAVVLQSDEKVYWANGVYDYMSVTFVHDNDISDLYVGKHLNQGEVFYQPGVKDPGGYTTGTHLHMCVNRGKTNDGISIFSGDTRPNEALFLNSTVSVQQTGNYQWKRVENVSTPSVTIDTGTYFIKNNSTGKYLDIKDGNDAQLQNVQVYAFNGSAAQSFEIKPSTTTTGYSMRPLLSTSRMVNVQADTVVSGKNVCLYNDTGHASQRWQFEKVSGGYVIRSVQNSGCVLDVESNGNVYVSTYSGKASQIWSLQNLVHYNANGGTGAPESQFKNHAETLKLSSTVPTREGYTFKGWATSKSATAAEYTAGANYTGNAAVTLYAVWQANTLKVSYDANGGTIAVDGYMLDGGLICNNDGTKYYQTWTYNNPKTNGLINRGTLGLARDGYSFMGWGTSPDGGVIFNPDDVDLTPTDIKSDIKNGSCSITLYAVWRCNHVYDTGCDVDCNTCGAVREVSGHIYNVFVIDATCAADGKKIFTCQICNDQYTEPIPATGSHAYDDEYDADCNVCGAVREVPEKPVDPVIPELPADAPAFVVESTSARAGQEFTVAVLTERNSGIVSLKLNVTYDANVLELVDAVEQDFAGTSFSPLTTMPFVVNWFDALRPDNTTNGVVALLTFRVKEDAPIGTTDIILSYDAADVFDKNYQNVAFRTEDGVVDIVDYVLGDVNGDTAINNKDLALLQQYVNKWDVQINLSAADVNADGAINNRDLALLQQYINKWDVILGK